MEVRAVLCANLLPNKKHKKALGLTTYPCSPEQNGSKGLREGFGG